MSHVRGVSSADVEGVSVVPVAGCCPARPVGLPPAGPVAGSDERWAAGRAAGEAVRVPTGRVDVERGVAEPAVVGVGREDVARWRVVVGAGRALVGRGTRVVVGTVGW